MICPDCMGTGFRIMCKQDGDHKVMLVDRNGPCSLCFGSGIWHCCDGDQDSQCETGCDEGGVVNTD